MDLKPFLMRVLHRPAKTGARIFEYIDLQILTDEAVTDHSQCLRPEAGAGTDLIAGHASVIQGVFEFQELFGAHGFPDFRREFLELVEVCGAFNCKVQPEATQAETSRQAYRDRVGF